MPKKLFIRTFGCQMNEYDSDRMADVLGASDGMTLTERAEDADVILFNTCSVREKARASSGARRTSTSCSARRRCIACPISSPGGARPAARKST